MVRIWFNHWFSTAYHIIRMMRENEPDFYVIGTNEQPYAVYRACCDEFYQEPRLHGDAYVDYALEFCRDHAVDVFVPRRAMTDISRRKAEFEAIGVRVMADDYENIVLLNDKAEAYRVCREQELAIVPEHEIVTDAAAFRRAYESLAETYQRVCFKFVRDEGGRSFRLIDNSPRGYDSLFQFHATRILFDEAYAALSEREKFAPLIVMPYLPNEEISVDTLKTESGIIMLPRIKGVTRVERMTYDPQILTMTEQLVTAFHLEMPCNVQYKYRDGIPYFLEINTRMSGGVQLACLASGVNIPNLAVNKLLDIRKKWEITQREVRVSYIETPLILE